MANVAQPLITNGPASMANTSISMFVWPNSDPTNSTIMITR